MQRELTSDLHGGTAGPEALLAEGVEAFDVLGLVHKGMLFLKCTVKSGKDPKKVPVETKSNQLPTSNGPVGSLAPCPASAFRVPQSLGAYCDV